MADNEEQLVEIRFTQEHAEHDAGDTTKVTPYLAEKLKVHGIAEIVEQPAAERPARRRGGAAQAETPAAE